MEWDKIYELVKVVDKTNAVIGEATSQKYINQSKDVIIYNLSDPELEDQINYLWKKPINRRLRKQGVFYGMLDKSTRSKKLSTSQKKRNLKFVIK